MNRHFFFCVLALLVALVCTPAVCSAAGDYLGAGFYTRGADAAAYIDQGSAVMDPFYLPVQTGAVLPRVTLAVMHEDNIFLEPDDPKAGTTICLIPGLLAIWGRPTHNHVYADYGLSIPIYQSENELDEKPSHMLKLGVVMATPKSQMRVEAGYRRQEDVDNTVGARVTQENFLGDANLEYRLSAKSSGGVLGRAERHLFDDNRYIDYDRYYGAGRLYYRATAKSEIFLQGGLGRDDPHENRDYASRADYFDLSLGLRGKQSPKFNTTGRIGYMWRTYDADRADYSHWIASVRAESSPFSLTTFTGELYADIRPAMDAQGVDTVDQGATISAARRLFIERLRGNASLTAGRVDYSGRAAAAEDNQWVRDGRADNYWGFSLGVDWWTKQKFSLGLAYSYMRRYGSRGDGPEAEDATSYEYGRWTLRASWNY